MRNFFLGWRRKAGCVLLVIASAFCAGWVRSQYIFERLEMHLSGTTRVQIFSDTNVLVLSRECTTYPAEMNIDASNVLWDSWPTWNATSADDKNKHGIWGNLTWNLLDHVEWSWRYLGFGIGQQSLSGYVQSNTGDIVHVPNLSKTRLWVVPYWFLTLPTLLYSAWLLHLPRKVPRKIARCESRKLDQQLHEKL